MDPLESALNPPGDPGPTAPLAPPPDFVDPRRSPAFAPEHWPKCDGGEVPVAGVDTCDLHDLRRVEFLASYYRLNVLQAGLVAAREAGLGPAVAAALRDLEMALADHDALEDRYSPIGFYGEPVMDGAFYREIEFNRPELPRLHPPASKASAVYAVPGLQFLPPGELEGEPYIGKWPW